MPGRLVAAPTAKPPYVAVGSFSHQCEDRAEELPHVARWQGWRWESSGADGARCAAARRVSLCDALANRSILFVGDSVHFSFFMSVALHATSDAGRPTATTRPKARCVCVPAALRTYRTVTSSCTVLGVTFYLVQRCFAAALEFNPESCGFCL